MIFCGKTEALFNVNKLLINQQNLLIRLKSLADFPGHFERTRDRQSLTDFVEEQTFLDSEVSILIANTSGSKKMIQKSFLFLRAKKIIHYFLI